MAKTPVSGNGSGIPNQRLTRQLYSPVYSTCVCTDSCSRAPPPLSPKKNNGTVHKVVVLYSREGFTKKTIVLVSNKYHSSSVGVEHHHLFQFFLSLIQYGGIILRELLMLLMMMRMTLICLAVMTKRSPGKRNGSLRKD